MPLRRIEGLEQRLTKVVAPTIKVAVEQLQRQFEDLVAKNFNTGPPPPRGVKNQSSKPYNRTGDLLESWRSGGQGNANDVKVNNTEVVVRWGSEVVYARYVDATHPYFTPAVEQFRQAFLPILSKEIADRLATALQSAL
jgi:hypothetical protein